jgi:thiol:disulfide interchange protein
MLDATQPNRIVMTNLKKRVLWSLIAALIAVGGYFAHTAWQTQRGEDALKATALDFLPIEQALARAKAQGKPVLVDFSAIWCPTCRVLHAEVFTNARVKQAITGGYVLSRVDYESPEAAAFMQRYAVQGFPSLLVLSADGTLLRRVPVVFDPAALAASLRG